MSTCYRGYRARRRLVRAAGGPVRSDVVRALPSGSRRILHRSIERQYLDSLTSCPDFQSLRADRRANLQEVAKWLARLADYHTGTTRPTRARICERAGVSESTWKACRRLLERWGYLGTVHHGCKRWRPGPDGEAAEVRCDAAVYVLCIPRARRIAAAYSETRPPTESRRDVVLVPAREAPPKGTSKSGAPLPGRAHRPRRLRRPAACSGSGAMAEVLRRGAGEGITEGWIGHLSRPFAEAGWTAADVGYAIEHTPDGRQHRAPVRSIKHPVGWLRWRLGHWLTEGSALPSVSQLRAAKHESELAEQRRRRAEYAAGRAAAADPAPHVDRILAQLGKKRPAR